MVSPDLMGCTGYGGQCALVNRDDGELVLIVPAENDVIDRAMDRVIRLLLKKHFANSIVCSNCRFIRKRRQTFS